MRPFAASAVLVVDDDLDHAQIARLVLRMLAPTTGVQVVHEASGAIARLDALPRGAVVLIDRWLHGVESFDTVVEMRSRRPDVHVVMLSAVLSSIDRAYALACGAVNAIEKPSSLDGWREALASIVGVDTDATPRAA